MVKPNLLYQVRILRAAGYRDAWWQVVGNKGRLLNETQAWLVRARLIRQGFDADIFSMGVA